MNLYINEYIIYELDRYRVDLNGLKFKNILYKYI